MSSSSSAAEDAVLDNFSQWKISEGEIPRGGNNKGKPKFLPLQSQYLPWIFRITTDNTIKLYADRTRALPVVDPKDRALTISCGAILFNLFLSEI